MSLLIETAVCLSVDPESEYRPSVTRMATSGLTSEAQLRYMLQWFGEFSELQREDFLPVLAAACGGKADQLAATLAALSCTDKPVSLFQCRIKLFNDWYPTWAEEEQERLIKGVSDMDSQFGEKLQEYLTNGPPVNGEMNGTEHEPKVEATELVVQDEVTVENHQSDEGIEPGIPQDNIPVEIAAAS